MRTIQLAPDDAAEVARFTDTGKTIVHRGRTYAILNAPAAEQRKDSPWVLRSQRGKYYALMRNRVRPEHLFGVGLYEGQFKCLDGWFTDKSGELASLG